jgi:hypothetical protein
VYVADLLRQPVDDLLVNAVTALTARISPLSLSRMRR